MNRFDDTIINYAPGARGEFLCRCLSGLELNMDEKFRNFNKEESYYYKKIEGTFFDNTERKQFSIPESAEKNIYSSLMEHSTMNNLQTGGHYICYLQDHILLDLQNRYKIYQIVMDKEHQQEVIFYAFLKGGLHWSKDVDDLKEKISNYKKGGRGFHEHYDSIARSKPLRQINFGSLFYPPYTAYRELYLEINGVEPDLVEYDINNKRAQVPRFINIKGLDIEVDLDNYTLKIL
jgi:hypothetical protein